MLSELPFREGEAYIPFLFLTVTIAILVMQKRALRAGRELQGVLQSLSFV
jgi:hypothetical protein